MRGEGRGYEGMGRDEKGRDEISCDIVEVKTFLRMDFLSFWRFFTPHRNHFGCVGNFLCGESPHAAKEVPLGRENLWREKITFKRENLCEENLTDLPFCFDLDNVIRYGVM